MSSRVFASSLAALTLLAVPVAVQAAPVERATAPATEENDLRGRWLWVLLAIGAIIAAILIFRDNEPSSP